MTSTNVDDVKVQKTDIKPEEKDSATKRALIGAGARILFYPTLLYNVVRHNFQPHHFRWWDYVDQFIILGAVPFVKDVLKLKKLGVSSVVTLNEPFETLVPTSLFQIEHKQMTPTSALEFVRSIRPRVALTPSQWKVVQDYKRLLQPLSSEAVIITKADLEGYEVNTEDDDGIRPKRISRTSSASFMISNLLGSFKVPCGAPTKTLKTC